MGYTKEQREAKKKSTETNVTTQEPIKAEIAEVAKVDKKLIRNLPLTSMVWVKSNTFGELIYISKKTGFAVNWEDFGATQPMSLEELMIMRNTITKFYSKNWITIEGFTDADYECLYSVEEILDFLQVKQYYTSSLCPKNIDDVFKMPIDQIKDKISRMSTGIKNSIVIRANDLIEKGELYDFRVITAIEDSTGCELRWLKKE